MANLLEDTLASMNMHGKTVDDIAWIGSKHMEIPIDKFMKLADKWYDGGFGAQEVATDLVVVFNDGTWLERHEYDGSEWWEYKKTPQRPNFLMENPIAVMRSQVPDRYNTFFDMLAEMNGLVKEC